jgi:hypothetical protein
VSKYISWINDTIGGTWAGTYRAAVNWTGAQGLFEGLINITVDTSGNVTSDGPIKRAKVGYDGTLAWERNQGNQSSGKATFHLCCNQWENSYFRKVPSRGAIPPAQTMVSPARFQPTHGTDSSTSEDRRTRKWKNRQAVRPHPSTND